MLPGALDVRPNVVAIDLAPLQGRGHRRVRVALPPITVIDARGDLAGWSLSLAEGSAADNLRGRTHSRVHVRVEPVVPSIVDGLSDGLVRGSGGVISDHRRVVELCRALAPGGGGTYSCRGFIYVSGEGDAVRDGATLTLRILAR